jgi:hypothetical protein
MDGFEHGLEIEGLVEKAAPPVAARLLLRPRQKRRIDGDHQDGICSVLASAFSRSSSSHPTFCPIRRDAL